MKHKDINAQMRTQHLPQILGCASELRELTRARHRLISHLLKFGQSLYG